MEGTPDGRGEHGCDGMECCYACMAAITCIVGTTVAATLLGGLWEELSSPCRRPGRSAAARMLQQQARDQRRQAGDQGTPAARQRAAPVCPICLEVTTTRPSPSAAIM
jgi:hypothetical protein